MSWEPTDAMGGNAIPGSRLSAQRRRHTDREVDHDEILTSAEAMQLLKIGRTKLWELIRDSCFPAYRVGLGRRSELRFKRSELLEWLEQNRV